MEDLHVRPLIPLLLTAAVMYYFYFYLVHLYDVNINNDCSCLIVSACASSSRGLEFDSGLGQTVCFVSGRNCV